MSPGISVEIRVSGRLGPELSELMTGFDVRVVPRHTVITIRSGDVGDLRGLLEAMGQTRSEIDRVIT